MEAIDAIKNIHEIGEINIFIGIISVVALIVLVITGIQKFMDVLGLETKGSLRRKAQEKRIAELENKIMLQESEIKKYNQKLYDKQKTYHEQSIQIRSNLEQNQDFLSKQITDFSNMMKDYINVQNARTIASFRSSLWRMHRDFTNQGYITADGLKTFLEMGKLYEDAGGNDIYHSKLLPEITALEIKYSKDDIIDKI